MADPSLATASNPAVGSREHCHDGVFSQSGMPTTVLILPAGCVAEFELYRQMEAIAIAAWILLLALFLKTLARTVFPANRKNKAQV
jgi:hypothetical protein